VLRGIYQHLDAFIELQRFESQLAIGDNYPIPHLVRHAISVSVPALACPYAMTVCVCVATTKQTQASKPAEDDQFERLPDEVLLHLFSFLSSEASLAKAELVCRRWRRGTAHKVFVCGVVANRLPLWVSCGGRATEPSGMEPRRRTQV
jgi:hypothetical protein